MNELFAKVNVMDALQNGIDVIWDKGAEHKNLVIGGIAAYLLVKGIRRHQIKKQVVNLDDMVEMMDSMI